jgi:integrase
MSLKIIRRAGRSHWYIRGTINGTRYDETTGTSDRGIADAYRIKCERELHHEAVHGIATRASFAEAAAHYIEQGGETRYVGALVARLGDLPLARVGQEQIDAAAKALYPQVSLSTRNRCVYVPASAVLMHASRLGWCQKPTLRRPRAPPGRVRWLTKPEADRLLAACQPHLRPLVYFLLFTGARIGEALWLDWSNIDLERRHVQFLDTKNGTSRGVPLHARVVEQLVQSEQRQGCVFRTPSGEPYARLRADDLNDVSAGTRIKTAFRGACRRAGLADFHPHDCRHTWATWHYQANHDIGALMRLGGWRTMSMVMRYAHTNVAELSHTIDAL